MGRILSIYDLWLQDSFTDSLLCLPIFLPTSLHLTGLYPKGDKESLRAGAEPIASPEACTKGQHLLKSRCLDPSSLIVFVLMLNELLIDRQAALISGLNS